MDFKKKLISIILASYLFMMNTVLVFAETFSDIPSNFWAYDQINSVTNDKIMTGYSDNTFRPNAAVTRADFTKMLLKSIGHDEINIETQNIFKDLTTGNYCYEDIMRSKQLGLVYGYPDKNFKPSGNITKTELSSVLSHITKGEYRDVSSLDKFFDKNEVPQWALAAYTKCVENNLYVNYPDENKLTPNKDATRAEIAVLLYKIKKAMDLVNDQYKGASAQPAQPKEYLIATEHLSQYKKADVNTVQITNLRKIVLAKNIIKASFKTRFNSNDSKIGDVVQFDIKKNIYTDEGTLAFPAGTVLVSEVNFINKQKMLNKSGEVGIVFKELILPEGKSVPFSARVVKSKGISTLSKSSVPKVAKFTTIGAGVGTVSGLAIGRMSDENNTGKGALMGLAIGAGTGLALGLITPGVPYKARPGDEVLVEITEDLPMFISL